MATLNQIGPCGVIAIPARLESTRLPNKLLLRDTGRPLLSHVIERAHQAADASNGLLREVVVACDDEQLIEIAEEAGATAVLTGTHHECGTTRIAEAIEKLQLGGRRQFVVNLQGDEPELAPEAVVTVARLLVETESAQMATLALAMPSYEGKENPNAVKVVFDASGRALYFSRAPIPYDRRPLPAGEPVWHHHLGIYAYRFDFLARYAAWEECSLERSECLEQLRVLHAGYTIQVGVVPAEWAGKGIDTLEDYLSFVKRHAA